MKDKRAPLSREIMNSWLLIFVSVVLLFLPLGLTFITIGSDYVTMSEFISQYGGSDAMWYWVFYGMTLLLMILGCWLRDRLFMLFSCFVELVYIFMFIVVFAGMEHMLLGIGFICMVASLVVYCVATVMMPQKEEEEEGTAEEEIDVVEEEIDVVDKD